MGIGIAFVLSGCCAASGVATASANSNRMLFIGYCLLKTWNPAIGADNQPPEDTRRVATVLMIP
jgi:hypothetical protein